MRMKKIRAAMAITQYYRRYKLRMYLQSLVAIGVETRRLYQHNQPISVQQRTALENWPTPPKTLANVVATIRRVYRRWKAWLLLRRIPRETWPEFRLKVIAAGALSGKRVNYGLSEKWHGNYLAMSEFNAGSSNVFENSIRQKLPPGQTVLFSSRIVKASNSLFKKSADRLVILLTFLFKFWILIFCLFCLQLIVTEEFIFNADPVKMNLINPKGVSIGDLTGIGLSKGSNDQLMVVQVRGGNDFIFALVDSNEPASKAVNRVGEFLAIILRQYFR